MDSLLGHFLIATSKLLSIVIQIYIFVIVVRSLLSWVGPIPNNPIVIILRRLTDPVFRFVHRKIPFTIVGGIDISPIIIIFALYFLDIFLSGVLNDWAAGFLKEEVVFK